MYGKDELENAVHGSNSINSAQREINIIFEALQSQEPVNESATTKEEMVLNIESIETPLVDTNPNQHSNTALN